jgi:hypothetical protein
MGYSTDTAPDSDLLTADKPVVIGHNWMRDDLTKLWWTATGTWAGADETDSDTDADYMKDEFDDILSWPDDGTADDTWFIMLDWGATAPASFNSMVLLGTENLDDTVRIRLQVDDGAAFPAPVNALDRTLSAGHTGRVTILGATTYSDVRYARIIISKTGNFATNPRVGEVVIGERVQLKHNPMLPHDPLHLIGSRARFESASGIMTDYSFHKGRRKINDRINPHETARISAWTDLFEDETEFGTLPFVWIDEPTTTPDNAYWMRFDEPSLMGPLVGYSEREFAINCIEQGPNFRRSETV